MTRVRTLRDRAAESGEALMAHGAATPGDLAGLERGLNVGTSASALLGELTEDGINLDSETLWELERLVRAAQMVLPFIQRTGSTNQRLNVLRDRSIQLSDTLQRSLAQIYDRYFAEDVPAGRA